jgi:hypothetical protein
MHHSQAKEVEAKLDPTYIDQPEEYMSMNEDQDLLSQGNADSKVTKEVSFNRQRGLPSFFLLMCHTLRVQ